jgi:hypothetical protein
MKWAGIAGLAGALLIAWWLYRVFGQPFDPPTEQDSFFYGVAGQFREPVFCGRISRYAAGSVDGWGRPGYQIIYLQSQCYFYLAGELHDVSLCDKVRPISRGLFDGSKFTPQACRKSGGYHISEIIDPHTVAMWMGRLGYGDEEFYHLTYRGYNSHIYEAYQRLSKEPAFKEKVAGSPSFDEPIASSSTRSPNDLEYLYAIFAIDSNEAHICEKISPNARKLWFNQGTVSLRIECYHDLAKNNRDPRFCQTVPASGQPPSGRADLESRETCLRDVEIVRREPTSKTYFGPALPPTYESFKKALEEIGYHVDLPRPTDSDYEDYLMYLAHQDPVGRADFLKRVAAIK